MVEPGARHPVISTKACPAALLLQRMRGVRNNQGVADILCHPLEQMVSLPNRVSLSFQS